MMATTLAVVWAGIPTATVAAPRKRAKYRFKVATLAPEGSAWMRVVNAMCEEILEKTGGDVQFKIYPGGVLGEEKDVLFKIRVGQVDGGGFLGSGLRTVCPNARAMMVPLLFEDYAEVDAVFDKLGPYFEAETLKLGYVALGWTEVGFSYLYSAEPVHNLADLRGAKPWMIVGDDITAELFRAAQVSGIPLPVSDVLTGLQTGLIKTVFSPALAAVATQWFTRVKYRNSLRIGFSFGGMFVSKKSWDRLPAETQKLVSEISHRRMTELTAQVRRSNEDALDVMAKNQIAVVSPNEADLQAFKDVSGQALEKLKGVAFPADAYDKVRQHLDAFRAERDRAAPATAPTTP